MNWIMLLLGFWVGGAFVSSFTIKSENAAGQPPPWYARVVFCLLWPVVLAVSEDR